MAFSLKCKIVSSEISVHGGLQQESRGHQQMQPGGRQELQGARSLFDQIFFRIFLKYFPGEAER